MKDLIFKQREKNDRIKKTLGYCEDSYLFLDIGKRNRLHALSKANPARVRQRLLSTRSFVIDPYALIQPPGLRPIALVDSQVGPARIPLHLPVRRRTCARDWESHLQYE